MACGLQMLIGDYLHTAGVIDLIQSDIDKAEEILISYFHNYSAVKIADSTPGSLRELVSLESMLAHFDR